MRWINEAIIKLNSAEYLINGGFYDISCLMSYYGALMAINQLIEHKEETFYNTSLVYSINRLSDGKSELLNSARILEAFSLPLRLTEALPQGTPSEYIDRTMAEEALKHAKAIVEFVKREMG